MLLLCATGQKHSESTNWWSCLKNEYWSPALLGSSRVEAVKPCTLWVGGAGSSPDTTTLNYLPFLCPCFFLHRNVCSWYRPHRIIVKIKWNDTCAWHRIRTIINTASLCILLLFRSKLQKKKIKVSSDNITRKICVHGWLFTISSFQFPDGHNAFGTWEVKDPIKKQRLEIRKEGKAAKEWRIINKDHCAVVNHVWLFVTTWTVAHQAPLSMGFSRQESWSGLPCPPAVYLPDPGIGPSSPALQVDSLPAKPQGKP